MKSLVCAGCVDIRALAVEWRTCSCGNTSARWIDPRAGTAEFWARDRALAFLLGMNNQLLLPALRGELGMFQDFRDVHDYATNAPNHVFDKSRAGCWAVIVRPGTTSDVTWAEEPPSVRSSALDSFARRAMVWSRTWTDQEPLTDDELEEAVRVFLAAENEGR